MNRLFIGVALLMGLASCVRTSDTVIRFQAEGLELQTAPVLVTRDSAYSLPMDSTHSMTFTLPAAFEPAYASLSIGDSSLLLYLEPGKHFNISLKMEDSGLTSVFTGKGSLKNQYLNSDKLDFAPDYNLDEADFLAALDAQWERMCAFMDTRHFDIPFAELERKRLAYTVYASLLNYPMYHIFYAQKWNYSPTQAYYDKIDAFFSEETDLLNIPDYQSFISRYVTLKQSQDANEKSEYQYIEGVLNYIVQHFKNPAVMEYLVDNFVYNYIERSGISELAALASVYETHVHSAPKKAKFKALCDKWLRIAEGQPSPSFVYEDVHGKKVALADLAGKYVYIDIWATWCGPCCRELPFLEKLEKKYKGKNISFVSISFDEKRETWEKMVKKENMRGIQLQAFKNDDFRNIYMITTIPRFILLDKEGKIINAHMTRPSDPETEKFFQTLKDL